MVLSQLPQGEKQGTSWTFMVPWALDCLGFASSNHWLYHCPLSPSILSSLIKYYLVYSLLCFILFCFLWSKYQMCTDQLSFALFSESFQLLTWDCEKWKKSRVFVVSHIWRQAAPFLSEEHAQPCVRRLRAPWRLACPARSGPHSHSLTCASDR